MRVNERVNKMTSRKRKIPFQIIITVVVAMFFIPIALSLIVLSMFLKQKIRDLLQKYGIEPVLYVLMNKNIKGLIDLIIFDFKQKKSNEG